MVLAVVSKIPTCAMQLTVELVETPIRVSKNKTVLSPICYTGILRLQFFRRPDGRLYNRYQKDGMVGKGVGRRFTKSPLPKCN